MDFRILGPLEVRDDAGRSRELGGRKQRALLAVLLLNANRVLSADRLVEALWGDSPPATAAIALQGYVSKLRKALGPAQAIVTRAPGYLLELQPGELDLDRFEQLVEEARRALAEHDPATAAGQLRGALALWRGPALGDLADESFARAETLRLEELRLATLEEHFETELALDRHAGLVGELETYIAQQPFRERPRAQLMLALYRSGRQAEALTVYREARRVLVDELGIEPGRALQKLQAAILRHDLILDLEPASGVVPPQTRYAKSGDVNIAYQVVGDGPVDLVYVPGWVSHVELAWELPDLVLGFERLASFSRLILFDKRGTGMSDAVPASELPTLEQRMDDVRAVMDAVGSKCAAIFGASEGGNMSMLFAATYPERTIALCTFGCTAKRIRTDEYPWAPSWEERLEAFAHVERQWTSGLDWEEAAPSLDPAGLAELSRYYRRCASPGAALALMKMNTHVDVRDVLPSIQVPTVVMHRTEDRDADVDEGRYIASRIPGARFVEFPGVDHSWWTQDRDAILDEIEELVTGIRPVPEPSRVLATVLFTDLVRSAERLSKLGDRDWAELLRRHEAAVRRELVRFRGEIQTTGDGFLGSFDGPARAIRCALAIRDAARALGIEIRTGLHTGECDLVGEKVAGIAVQTGARVASLAAPGEVLVSSTVKDLVAGSGIDFDERGEHELKGVPGSWRLYAVAGD
jgi:DNA-binding SARP family transcriptional activator/pimeloyl-ACP methyl ester carboxylesterase